MATKILLVSDDKKIEKIMNEHIKEHSFSISIEHSGSAAISKVKKTKPDMVMVDLAVPKKDGWEIIDEMQSLKSLAKIPVVVVDDKKSHKNEIKAFEVGAAAYTSKAAPAELILQKLYSIQALAALQTRNKKPIVDALED